MDDLLIPLIGLMETQKYDFVSCAKIFHQNSQLLVEGVLGEKMKVTKAFVDSV